MRRMTQSAPPLAFSTYPLWFINRRIMAEDKTGPAAGSTPPPAASATKGQDKSGKPGNGKIWMGTAVGIGSAAIVAALLYAKRRP